MTTALSLAPADGVVQVVTMLGTTVLELHHVEPGGRVRVGDTTLEAPRGGSERVRVGLVDVVMTPCPRPRRTLGYARAQDYRLVRYVALALAGHLVLWALAVAYAPYARYARGWTRSGPQLARLGTETPASARGASPVDRELGVVDTTHAIRGANAPAAVAGRARTERQAPDRTEVVSRAQAIEHARNAGVLGAIGNPRQFAAIVGTHDLRGIDGGAVRFGGDGERLGGFGIGGRTFGPEGGGGGLIGAGRYGTGALGSRTGAGYGLGGGLGGVGLRSTLVPTVVLCGPRPDGSSCANAIGAHDKSMIRRYVRRNLTKIAYCYEKELLASPSLAGEVKTEFVIANDGRVQSATADGVSAEVASCVAGVIANIEFPRAKDPGITVVTYPFTFRAP